MVDVSKLNTSSAEALKLAQELDGGTIGPRTLQLTQSTIDTLDSLLGELEGQWWELPDAIKANTQAIRTALVQARDRWEWYELQPTLWADNQSGLTEEQFRAKVLRPLFLGGGEPENAPAPPWSELGYAGTIANQLAAVQGAQLLDPADFSIAALSAWYADEVLEPAARETAEGIVRAIQAAAKGAAEGLGAGLGVGGTGLVLAGLGALVVGFAVVNRRGKKR